jgi:hypothetical protein
MRNPNWQPIDRWTVALLLLTLFALILACPIIAASQ